MAKFELKTVWITGASSGIGEATAYRMAEEKARLILTSRNTKALEQVKVKALALGAEAVEILAYDLSELDGLTDLAETAWKLFGSIDVMYNNAGISQRANTLDTSLETIRRIMDLDYYAPVILTKALLPLMLANGGGQFVVTTSIAGKFGFPLRSAYCSAKHALSGFFETIQAEYFKENIRVTIICLGRVNTNISFFALGKDGKEHGTIDPGQAKGLSAKKAAQSIVKAIYKQKNEAYIGGIELIMVYMKRFFPAIAARMARNISAV